MANDITRAEFIPAPIENAKVVKAFVNGEHRRYEITPVYGYVLHNNVRDWTERNEETGEETLYLGYSTSYASVPANYDFNENPNELYAVPADSVPAEQIF